jgi:hypothetical protein
MSVSEYELKERAIAPRVTLEQVEASIISEHYFTAGDGDAHVAEQASLGLDHIRQTPVALNCLTFCILVLRNGYTVSGQSACADPANFKPDIGRRLARVNAVNQIWTLLGYELKTKLALVEQAGVCDGDMAKLPGLKTYIGTNVIYAVPMTRGLYNEFRGWFVPADEWPDDAGFLVQYTDGGLPNINGFTGYVSWSPKEVFEAAYKAIR